ncbi:MAG: tetratricopeptide repeat protein [Verrucomicrobia bacterium]|nr:tetratricopeptide repeat protein [Verrucomicrobiota bacterium]
MVASILNELLNLTGGGAIVFWIGGLGLFVFQVWMFVDAVRRGEYFWAVFIWIGSLISTVLYFFLVYRDGATATSGFELPGAARRARIKELQSQIHHLDKAHHHLQLGDIYFAQGKLDQAEASYRASIERDATDPDAHAHLGQCLLRKGKPAEARPLLESVVAQNPKHDYGHTLMALAETLTALGEQDAALAAWHRVLAEHSYARARVQCAELLIAKGETTAARHELAEVISDDAHAPAFQRRRERMWVKRAGKLLGALK